MVRELSQISKTDYGRTHNFANCLRTDTQGDYSAHSESRPRLTLGRAINKTSRGRSMYVL